jgi:hypothetical protein
MSNTVRRFELLKEPVRYLGSTRTGNFLKITGSAAKTIEQNWTKQQYHK